MPVSGVGVIGSRGIFPRFSFPSNHRLQCAPKYGTKKKIFNAKWDLMSDKKEAINCVKNSILESQINLSRKHYTKVRYLNALVDFSPFSFNCILFWNCVCKSARIRDNVRIFILRNFWILAFPTRFTSTKLYFGQVLQKNIFPFKFYIDYYLQGTTKYFFLLHICLLKKQRHQVSWKFVCSWLFLQNIVCKRIFSDEHENFSSFLWDKWGTGGKKWEGVE